MAAPREGVAAALTQAGLDYEAAKITSEEAHRIVDTLEDQWVVDWLIRDGLDEDRAEQYKTNLAALKVYAENNFAVNYRFLAVLTAQYITN